MTYGDVKCGSFNKLVGVDSECDSWVLETIHGVASGSATIIWSKRLAHRGCPSATVRLRVAPLYGEQSGDMGDGLGGSIPQWEIRFESDALHKMPYQPSSRLSGLVSDCTGISVKGLGLALACFSDVG